MWFKKLFQWLLGTFWKILLKALVEVKHFPELVIEDQELVEAARQVRKNAHTEQSKFKVGAALRVHGQTEIFLGCNVENVIYLACHAEHAATINMITKLGCDPKPVIKRIAITLKAGEKFHAFPCGLCRQLIFEFGTEETVVLGARIDADENVTTVEIVSLGVLYPFAFGPKNLGK